MEKQHLKRLGYGFSALVMALSTVTFMPSSVFADTTTHVTTATDITDATAGILYLDADITLEATPIAVGDGETITVNLNNHNIAVGEAGTVFSIHANGTLKIEGAGTIIGDLSDGTGTIEISGGTYTVDPSANVVAGFTAYEVEEGATWEVKATSVYTGSIVNTQPNWKRTLRTNRPVMVGTYNTVTVAGEEWTPSVVVKDTNAAGEVIDDSEIFEVTVAEGKVEVTAKAEGKYYLTITDAAGTASNLNLNAYTLDAENSINGNAYAVEVGDELDLTDDFNGSFVNAVAPGYTASGFAGKMTQDGLKFTATAAGSVDLDLKLLDMDNNTTLTATVEIYDTTPVTLFMNATDADLDTALYGTNWASATSADESIVAASIDEETGNLKVSAEGVGETTVTLKSSDAEDAIEKVITFGVYSVETNKVLETTDDRLDMTTLASLPEGYTLTITANDADESKVSYAAGTELATPIAAGERTFTYAIAKGATPVANKAVTLYVKGANVEIADRYVKVNVNDTANLGTLYAPTLAGTTVTATLGEDDLATNAPFKSTTTGDKVVTFTEKAADGTVITTEDVTFHVYGVALADVDLFVGEEKEVTLDADGVTVTDFATSSATKFLVTPGEGYAYTFNTTEKGNYTINFTVTQQTSETISESGVVYGPFNVYVHEKMTISEKDLEIDIAEEQEEENTTASFTIAGDGACVITEVDAEGEAVEAEDQVLVADGENPAGVAGVYTFTTTATEVGTHYLKVTQTIGGLTSEETLEVTITDSSAEEAVELESVSAEIVDGAIVTTYNEGYEGEPVLAYAVEEDFAEIVTVTDGAIAVDEEFLTATDVDVVITVTATDGEIVKTATATYTIEANYTEVEAEFEDDKDSIKPSETTKIVTKAVDGVVYTYDFYGANIDIAEDGTITVSDDYLSTVDTEVVITVNGFAGEGDDEVLLTSKDLTLTIAANYSYIGEEPDYDVLDGDGQTFTAGSDESLTIRIDAPYNQVTSIEIVNQTLFDYLEELVENGATIEDALATLTEQEQNSIWMWLTEGEDYTIAEGSTVITLTNSLLSRLAAGTYNMYVEYLDDTDIDNVIGSYAQASFTVEGGSTTATPDTGAAVKGASSATASIVTSVLGAITMAGAAIVTKFAKRR